MKKMIQQAENIGTDTIVMVRINTKSIVQNSSVVRCHCTAFKFI